MNSARKADLIFQEQEQERILNHLAVMPLGTHSRCITAVARRMLLDGPYFLKGELCDPKIKNLGAGVYQVWLEAQKS